MSNNRGNTGGNAGGNRNTGDKKPVYFEDDDYSPRFSGGGRRNNRNDRNSESYGIFDETSFAKQKISGLPSTGSGASNNLGDDTNENNRREPRRNDFRNENYRNDTRSYRMDNRNDFRGETDISRQDNKRPIRNEPLSQAPAKSALPLNNAPKNFFVFDIETVPCVETARIFLNLGSEVSEEEVLSKLTAYHSEITNGQNEFYRQLFHKIVCVSFIVGSIHPLKGGKEKYVIKDIRTGGRKGETEEEILRTLFTYLGKHPSRLISFNGRGFDLPVLQYRAMKYGIDAKWIYNDGYYNYNHRYSIEKHCDLLDMFSNFGASARVKMAEVASLFKIPSKINGVTGADVYGMFKEGKIEEICNYCENDVIATYILYLRFMQHSGKVSAEGYNIVIDSLLAKLKESGQSVFAEEFLKMNNGNVHLFVTTNVSSRGSETLNEEQNENNENPSENIKQGNKDDSETWEETLNENISEKQKSSPNLSTELNEQEIEMENTDISQENDDLDSISQAEQEIESDKQ
jgi:predicted PolB exonuclease-like 3'-5' exonuclease